MIPLSKKLQVIVLDNSNISLVLCPIVCRVPYIYSHLLVAVEPHFLPDDYYYYNYIVPFLLSLVVVIMNWSDAQVCFMSVF